MFTIIQFKKFILLSILVLSIFAVTSCAEAQPSPALPTAADVWMYLPFNGSLDALKPNGGLRTINFQSANKDTPELSSWRGLKYVKRICPMACS